MPSNRPTDGYLPALTGLRGLAAAWVALFHLWQFGGGGRVALGPIDVTPWLATGYLGVDLFFVLSGFLLGQPFVRAAATGMSVPLGPFWRNRLRRVLPAYWAQIAVLGLVSLIVAGAPPAEPEWLGHLSLSFNLWRNDSALNPVYWSLPVEWDFYLLLPLLGLGFARSRRAWLTVAAVLLLSIGFRFACVAALHAWGEDGIGLYRWIIQLPGRLDQFVFGMMAAWCWQRDEGRPRRGWLWTGAALVLAWAWLVADKGDLPATAATPWLYWHYSVTGLGFAMLTFGAASPTRSVLTTLLISRPLAWLGMVSYSLYLWHYPVLQWQTLLRPPAWPVELGVAASLAPILVLSWASYRYVERPFLGARARRAEAGLKAGPP